MDLVVVLTCPRPGAVSYLRETCDALIRPGVEYRGREEEYTAAGVRPWLLRVVMSDGLLTHRLNVAHLKNNHWGFYESLEQRGSRHAHWRAFHLAVALAADNLLLFEDDVRPCRNAVRRMLDVRVPDDLAHVTFFDMKELPEGSEHRLHVLPVTGNHHDDSGFWGMQALKIPRRTLEWLVRQDPTSILTEEPEVADRAFGLTLARSPWPHMAVHCPSLVEHVGAVSSFSNRRLTSERLARNFPGHDFDAMTLGEY